MSSPAGVGPVGLVQAAAERANAANRMARERRTARIGNSGRMGYRFSRGTVRNLAFQVDAISR